MELKRLLWPDVTFYRQQRLAIYSAIENDETYVPAANKMGKDFLAGFTVLYFFLTRTPCRIVTTSAKDDHLRVLWGEINQFVRQSRYPLEVKHGGPLMLKHQEIDKYVQGQKCPKSYIKGLVASPDSIAAMQGHHVAKTGDGIPRTMFVSDESSSVPDDYYRMARTWFNRALIFGNTWECENFFRQGVDGGDVPDPEEEGRFNRKVIRIRADDSPNVILAREEIAAGQRPSNRIVVPGVKDWQELQRDRRLWDAHQQCVSLDAEFYVGRELMLFPPDWRSRSREVWRRLRGQTKRQAKAIGIDPAEGGDKTAMAAVDEYGLIELVSRQTPNTTDVTAEAIEFGRRHNVPPHMWMFDRGGGKVHADRLIEQGYKGVQTVGFGETVGLDLKRGLQPMEVRRDVKGDAYAYVNRRAQLFGELSMLFDPSLDEAGWGVPEGAVYDEFLRQLRFFPKKYDSEGRLKLPPKNKRAENSKEKTLVEMIGHSPDEADAVALAVYCMNKRPTRAKAG